MSLFTAAKPSLNRLVLILFFSTLVSCATSEQKTKELKQPLSEQIATPSPGSTPSSGPIILTNPTQAPASSSTSSSTPTPLPASAAPKAGAPSPNSPNPSKQKSQVSPKKVAFSRTPYAVINEAQQDQFNLKGEQIFKASYLPKHQVDFNEADLLAVLINVKAYFENHSHDDPTILRAGVLETGGVAMPEGRSSTIADIQETLTFMIHILEQDITLQRPTRLKDPNFINTYFQVMKWQPYNPQQPDQNQLRITKYAVFAHPGSRTKTAEFNTPLYQLKPEYLADQFYTQYSKQDILAGLYETGGKEQGKVEPLVYLTRQGLEDALLQGTILVQFQDGSSTFYNVDRNNGIAYIRGLDQREQKRYWYFKQVNAIKGYGPKSEAKIPVRPGVTFAGDVLNIGLGKIIMLEHDAGGSKQLKMGVLADTGGAFQPNLYQLDFLAGIFSSQAEFEQHVSTLPTYANAYILIKKKNL